MEVGRGGFSRVFAAYQVAFDRRVAIKVLNGRLADDESVAAFERECQAMGALSRHPFIVTVLSSAFTSDYRPCIVMDLFDQGNYMQLVRRDGPLPLEELLAVGVRVAGALATAHQDGVIHGDVKPQNIFKSAFGFPALGDFGIATLRNRATERVGLGMSPHFVAPELVEGGAAAVVAAADQYSLGATLYTLATGWRPFESDSPQAPQQILARALDAPTPTLPKGFPKDLAAVLRRAMARVPHDRYPDLDAFAVALANLEHRLGYRPTAIPIAGIDDDATIAIDKDTLEALRQRTIPPPPIPDTPRQQPPPPKRRRRILIAALVLLAVAGATTRLTRNTAAPTTLGSTTAVPVAASTPDEQPPPTNEPTPTASLEPTPSTEPPATTAAPDPPTPPPTPATPSDDEPEPPADEAQPAEPPSPAPVSEPAATASTAEAPTPAVEDSTSEPAPVPPTLAEEPRWFVNDEPYTFGGQRHWSSGTVGHGFGSNNYEYTFGIGGASSAANWAHWDMGNRVGRQEIQVYVPANHAVATVTYTIHVADRQFKVKVVQSNISGWHSLGTRNTNGANVTVSVFDNEVEQHMNTDGFARSSFGVDAVRMRCVANCE